MFYTRGGLGKAGSGWILQAAWHQRRANTWVTIASAASFLGVATITVAELTACRDVSRAIFSFLRRKHVAWNDSGEVERA